MSSTSRLQLAVVFVVAVFVLYWLPQAGSSLTSDVTWIYRMQVTDTAAITAVPNGLRQFSGAPMGWLEACAAHYESFRRLNCADIALWRLSALIAGNSAPGWLAISLAINCATILLMDAILRRLATPWPLRAAALVGLALVPKEVWLTAVTSEPRVGLIFALAAWAALAGRTLLAALFMGVAVLTKEPSFVWWPFIGALAMAGPKSETLRWRALAPHVVIGAVVLAAGVAVWFLIPAKNDYPFLLTIPYPEPSTFVHEALNGITPLLIRPWGWWALAAATVTLLVGAWRTGQLSVLWAAVRSPAFWLPIVAGILGIAGHLAVHWLTRRTVGDSRYVVPANLAVVLLIALWLRPFIAAAAPPFRLGALCAGLAALLAIHPWGNMEWVAMGFVVAAATVMLAALAAGLLRFAGVRAPVGVVAAAGLLGFLATPALDQSLQMGASLVVDARDWNDTVSHLATTLPRNAFVVLNTGDPLMIETVLGLQAEFLFRNRADVAFRAYPRDTTFYGQEQGLVRRAHDAFNADRPTEDDARRSGRPTFSIDMDRTGNAASAGRPQLTWQQWIALLVTDPAAFYRQRYAAWPTGYLNATLSPMS